MKLRLLPVPVSFHESKPLDVNVRVSNPGVSDDFDLAMPSNCSRLAGAGSIFLD